MLDERRILCNRLGREENDGDGSEFAANAATHSIVLPRKGCVPAGSEPKVSEASTEVASPRSRSFTCPFGRTMKFSGLMSWCTTPAWCAAARASVHSIAISMKLWSESGAPNRSRNGSPGTYSRTRKISPSCWTTSSTVAMRGSEIWMARLASSRRRCWNRGSPAQLGGDALERYLARQLQILGKKNLSHAAGAKRALDDVMGHPLPNHDRVGDAAPRMRRFIHEPRSGPLRSRSSVRR